MIRLQPATSSGLVASKASSTVFFLLLLDSENVARNRGLMLMMMTLIFMPLLHLPSPFGVPYSSLKVIKKIFLMKLMMI